MICGKNSQLVGMFSQLTILFERQAMDKRYQRSEFITQFFLQIIRLGEVMFI